MTQIAFRDKFNGYIWRTYMDMHATWWSYRWDYTFLYAIESHIRESL